MIIKYSPSLLEIIKKTNVRIRKSFKERIEIFSQDPYQPQLNNHPLRDKYQGYRSIDITSDWRAIFTEVRIEKDTVAYFIALGTHGQLYGR